MAVESHDDHLLEVWNISDGGGRVPGSLAIGTASRNGDHFAAAEIFLFTPKSPLHKSGKIAAVVLVDSLIRLKAKRLVSVKSKTGHILSARLPANTTNNFSTTTEEIINFDKSLTCEDFLRSIGVSMQRVGTDAMSSAPSNTNAEPPTSVWGGLFLVHLIVHVV